MLLETIRLFRGIRLLGNADRFKSFGGLNSGYTWQYLWLRLLSQAPRAGRASSSVIPEAAQRLSDHTPVR